MKNKNQKVWRFLTDGTKYSVFFRYQELMFENLFKVFASYKDIISLI